MICLRCGYCCIEYVVGIVNNPELGISEDNILPKTSGERCKHLIGPAPGEYSCAIHNYEWYEETPCAEFTQVGKPDSPCRRGEQILKRMAKPCVQCGYCCKKARCVLSQIVEGPKADPGAPCPYLSFDGEKYNCGLAETYTIQLYIGEGCCAPLNTDRIKYLGGSK